ncbi:type II toxin-antitoxin system VapC family toxin [Microbacterium luticocti]|uniref:type II toxin-antitoxin system VapC family toxin n=1 Tax=Microbacterium luticocti TaxID=451764 RepID=UPI0003FB25CA|nr:type II toxin-antitoxin system VapC family toxin [Microbacterium luticocti]
MIDTSVLIGVLPDQIVDAIEDHGASHIVRGELLRGAERFAAQPNGRELARVRAQLVSALDELRAFWRPFDGAASTAYASLTAMPPSAARSKDALIAAHAVSLGVPVITADRGFTRFTGLEIIFTE